MFQEKKTNIKPEPYAASSISHSSLTNPECFVYTPKKDRLHTLQNSNTKKSLTRHSSVLYVLVVRALEGKLELLDSNHLQSALLGMSPEIGAVPPSPLVLIIWIVHLCT